jgi:hypothetical protein
MLINKDANPADNIYYIACCILEEVKGLTKVLIDECYYTVMKKYNKSLKYTDYLLALNFLFLIEKINFKEGGLSYVY